MFPALAFSQAIYDKEAMDKYKYKEIGDTLFINNSSITPGDTIRLGTGSAPDGSFIFIYQLPLRGLVPKLKYLPKELSNTYLIYTGRKKIKAIGYNQFYPVFLSNGSKKKEYTITLFQAIETREILLN